MYAEFSSEKDVVIVHRQDNIQSYMTADAQNQHPHFHYQYELLFVAQGSCEFVINNKLYHLTPGSILFISNNENHHIQSYSDNFDRYTLRFSTEIVATYLRDPFLLSVFRNHSENFCHLYQCTDKQYQRFQNLCRIMEKEYSSLKPYWAQMIASKLLTILVDIYRQAPSFFPSSETDERQALIFDIQTYIELHSEEELTLESLANIFFVSKYHLSRCFSNVSGHTFKDFLITTRIAKAKELLLTTNKDIASIGQQVGFHDISNFIRTFRKREGISPLQFRNQTSNESV